MHVWQQVKVIKNGHEREGQAGTVQGVSATAPDSVYVVFDRDLKGEAVLVADLLVLA